MASQPLPPPPPSTLAASFLRDARALAAAEIVPLHADATVAEKNVAAGVAAVLAYDRHIAEHLPHVDLAELRSLPDLARAVADAAREAGSEDDETGALLEEAYALRRRLRTAAVALSESGALAPRELAKLGNDRNAVDVGADCSALGALFHRRAEDVAGLCSFGDEDVARATELGSALKARYKPAGTARKPGPDGLSPIEKRDRLWTLLVLRHERLWAVGAYVYGHVVDEHVPALHAPPPAAPRRTKAKRE